MIWGLVSFFGLGSAYFVWVVAEERDVHGDTLDRMGAAICTIGFLASLAAALVH